MLQMNYCQSYKLIYEEYFQTIRLKENLSRIILFLIESWPYAMSFINILRNLMINFHLFLD